MRVLIIKNLFLISFFLFMPSEAFEAGHILLVIYSMTSQELRKIQITVPPECGAGDVLDVVLQMDAGTIHKQGRYQKMAEARHRLQFHIVLWFMVELICITFLGLTIGLNNGAKLNLSRACGAINPTNGKSMSSLYLNFFYGLSSAKNSCATSGDEFCYNWNEPGWDRFEVISGSSESATYYYVSTKTALYTGQVLIGLTLGFVVFSAIAHGYIIAGQTQKSEYGLFLAASYSLLVAWSLW